MRELAEPGTEQRLGASERLFVALRRFTPTNVVRVIAIEGALAPRDVEAALAKLAARHPHLRARIVDGDAPFLVHGGAPPIPLEVVARRDDRHWPEVLSRVLNTPLSQEAGRHFHVLHLHSERSRRAELVLAGEHALCDGVSMNRLASELAGLCARRSPEPPRRSLPVLEALLPPFSPVARATSFGRSLRRFARVAVERSLYESRGAATSSTHLFAELDQEETRALLARSRAARTTVTGSLMAAVLLAVNAVRRGAPRLALSVPIDLRPRIPHHALEPDDLGNYTNAVYLESKADAQFFDLARGLKRQLEETMQGDRVLSSLSLVYGGGRRFVRAGRPPFAHAMVSSSGIVPLDRDYGAFRVLGFYSATSAPMISADFSFFVNTFDERLCINLVFAEEVVSYASAERVLARVRELLTKELA